MALKRIENRGPGQREIHWADRSDEKAKSKLYAFPRATTDSVDGKVTPGFLMVDEKIVSQWLDPGNDPHVASLFDEKTGDLVVADAKPAADDGKAEQKPLPPKK